MLVLTRKMSQSIVINNDINITVLGINGNHVKFGIEAPKEISVHRLEIQELINKEKTELKKQLPLSIETATSIMTKKSFDKDDIWIKPTSKRNQYFVKNGMVKSMQAGQ